MPSKLLTSYTSTITCVRSISMSVICSSSLAEEESSSTVEVFIGSMYKSGDIITGWYDLHTVRGNVSDTRVIMMEVLPTPSIRWVKRKWCTVTEEKDTDLVLRRL